MGLNVKQYRESTIRQATESFIRDVDGLRDGLPIAMGAIQASRRHAHDAFTKFQAENCKKIVKENKTLVAVPFELSSKYDHLRLELSKSFSVYSLVERSFLVSLISQYDAFLGKLVRALIEFKPHALNRSVEKVDELEAKEKALTYSELLKFSSIDEVKEHVISEAIDNLLRKSHKDQFLWLEKHFEIPLRTDLPSWAAFIEITQRRHLFVHADGVVSKQYLKKCSEDGVKLSPELKPGFRLHVDKDYLIQSRKIIYEIGFKLSQVLWRKVVPGQIEWADVYLNNTAYHLISKGEYDLAINLLDFACKTLKRHQDEKTERMFIINRALAYKLSGSTKTATEIIHEHDWTATGDLFSMAVAALKDDVPAVIRHMKQIGKSNSDIDLQGYREWPLFSGIRDNAKFQAAFKSIYRKPFVPVVVDFVSQNENPDLSDLQDENLKKRPIGKVKAQRISSKMLVQ